MRRLNIAFYTDVYLPGVDGVVTSTLNFKDELERKGHNVYIFASSDSKNIRTYSKKNVFLYPGVKFRPYPQYNVALFPYNSIFRLSGLDIDIIHAQTPMVMGFAGLMASKLLRIPFVSTFHTMVTNKPIVDTYYPKNRHLRRIATDSLTAYMKVFYNSCDRVIAPSETVRSILHGYGISKLSVVPNGVDTRALNPNISGVTVRRRYGINGRERVILYLGRLSREKKLEVLLRAVRLLASKNKNIRLLIGGTGPAEHYYTAMARRMGISANTTFLGFVTADMLPSVYAASDVFCLPSTFETQGIVLLEAMAMGKPVVGADYLAIAELIKNGENGEKFRPGDYTECARKIEKVLNSTGHYKENAIRTAAEFSKEKVADTLIDVYNLVLSKKAIY
ncbi:MAG: glycosyltransferase [Candidatus Marsarchaeota archaeon]|nr:glycosyltransferase [Candidatus Marsarchaeota archaeon]MCL5412801.1 glycosyltransferase [Candidatus Marsarchaeota archaeon]